MDVVAAKVSDIAIKNLFKSSTMNTEKLSIDILSCKLQVILYDSWDAILFKTRQTGVIVMQYTSIQGVSSLNLVSNTGCSECGVFMIFLSFFC